jgi:uncharacterized protein
MLNTHAIAYCCQETQIPLAKVNKTLELLVTEECTIPFIARYRKEVTGGLDEVQISTIGQKYEEYLETEKRRKYILETIEEQKLLTDEIKNKILQAKTLNELEDIYAPFKSKKKTKGQIAIDNGLGPLAQILLEKEEQEVDFTKFFNEEIKTKEDAIEGVKSIYIEEISHSVELKKSLRELYWNEAILSSSLKKDADKIKDYDKFKDYFEYSQKIKELTKNMVIATLLLEGQWD